MIGAVARRAAAAVAIGVVFVGPVVLPWTYLSHRDIRRLHLPLRHFLAAERAVPSWMATGARLTTVTASQCRTAGRYDWRVCIEADWAELRRRVEDAVESGDLRNLISETATRVEALIDEINVWTCAPRERGMGSPVSTAFAGRVGGVNREPRPGRP